MNIIEAKSVWKTTKIERLTILAYDGAGKIQIDFIEDENNPYGRTAFIWDLFVAPECRKNGIARELMQYALKRAKENGYDTATLEWVLEDTPREIVYWYARLGFEEIEFSDDYALMRKQL